MFKKGLAIVILGLLAITAVSCGSKEEKKAKFYNRGMALFEQADYKKANLEFKNALQIDPKFADAYYMLGKVQLEAKELKSAFGYFKKSGRTRTRPVECAGRIGPSLFGGKGC
jgi:Tfp pilus assembly protein PilF